MKVFKGEVISTKMNKAATVLITRYRQHPLYGKILRRNTKIHTTNEAGAKVGDIVEIVETRPVSKTINFKIKAIIKSSNTVELPKTEVKKTVKQTKKVKKVTKEAKK